MLAGKFTPSKLMSSCDLWHLKNGFAQIARTSMQRCWSPSADSRRADLTKGHAVTRDGLAPAPRTVRRFTIAGRAVPEACCWSTFILGPFLARPMTTANEATSNLTSAAALAGLVGN
jgi:hypothetical protein